MARSFRPLAIVIVASALAATSARDARAQSASTEPVGPDRTVTPRRTQSPPPGVRRGTTIEGAQEAWNPRWQYRVGWADYALIGAGAAVGVGAAIIPPRSSSFRTGIGFDDAARDTLRVGPLDNRYRIRDASDVGISLLTTWPVLVDALVTAWWFRGNSEVAKQIAVVDLEVVALVAAAQGVTNTMVGRQRPYGGDCGAALPERSLDCEDRVRYRSFFSGHASQAFASASVICVNHLGMGLIGSSADHFMCAGAVALAASTAMFRVMGDMHYASDVLIGAAVGTTFGLGIPLLHGTQSSYPTTGAGTGSELRLKLAPVGTGLGVRGTF